MTQFPDEADRHASKELWVQTIRGAMDAGQKITTVPARTPKERHKAKEQSIALSRKSYGWNAVDYERINWNH